MHRYQGLGYDAQLYAFQALAQIHPALKLDLFLQYSSQDRYSLFSPFYAAFIRLWGLEHAALILTIFFKVCLLTAAWHIIRKLKDADTAWLSLGILVIIIGRFGGFSVFHYSEDFLTARSAAEALVIIGLALNIHSHRAAALATIAVGMAVHPIMALPGLVMLACLWMPLRWSIAAALLGLLATLLLAIAASTLPAVARVFPLLDAEWLYVVRERSQYLLLDIWKFEDWRLNARPFASLALTVMAVEDPQVRRLAFGSMIVGASGLAVGVIGSLIGPVALLVQMQPWRLEWVTAFFAVLLLPMTVLAVLRDRRCGLLCASFAGLAWTYDLIDNFTCAALAAGIYALRDRIDERVAVLLKWCGIAILTISGLWVVSNIWTCVSAPFDTKADPLPLQIVKNVLGLQTPMVIVTVLAWMWVKRPRSPAGGAAVFALLALVVILVVPSSFRQGTPLSAVYKPGEFTDWQAAIPEDKNVVIAIPEPSSIFGWFVLQRPIYLSEAQSAGVVFSRDTALEVKRRSDVLEPLVDPNWKIFSSFIRYQQNPNAWKRPQVRALTVPLLRRVCGDPKLDFLIAKENVGFGAREHRGKSAWGGWHLYDCAAVRASGGRNAPAG